MPVSMTNPTESVWPAHLEPPVSRPAPMSIRLPKYRSDCGPSPRQPRQRYVIAAREILTRAAIDHGMTFAVLMSGGQSKRQCAARRRAALEMREKGMTFEEIGQVMGRHHTSILNLLKRTGRRPMPLPTWDPFAPDLSGEWAI